MNACQRNETMGVQRDGAMTEYISVPREKLYVANLSLKELCLVEPLTVGFHAVARGRVEMKDTVAVFGCGAIGLGAIAGSAFRGAETIAIDMDDAKLAIARKAGATHTINYGARESACAVGRDYGWTRTGCERSRPSVCRSLFGLRWRRSRLPGASSTLDTRKKRSPMTRGCSSRRSSTSWVAEMLCRRTFAK